MTDKVENPLAFPKANYGHGMTLRDWFAGQALAGMVSRSGAMRIDGPTGAITADAAYAFADAMLEAREARP